MTPLRLSGLRVEGRDRPRLDGLDLELASGSLTVVIGPNGAGKSTLIRVLAGLETAFSGQVTLGGRSSGELSRVERAGLVAWLPQSPRIEEGLTALEVVASARFRFAESWAVSRDEARRSLQALGALQWADRPMDQLSGGEAQRVRMAALAAQQTDWWLLDEPANHLDPSVRLDLLGRITGRVADGGGVVLVTHDLGLLPHLPNARVVALDAGRLVHDAPVDDPGLADALGELFGLDLRSVEIDGQRVLVIVGGRT